MKILKPYDHDLQAKYNGLVNHRKDLISLSHKVIHSSGKHVQLIRKFGYQLNLLKSLFLFILVFLIGNRFIIKGNKKTKITKPLPLYVKNGKRVDGGLVTNP